MTVVAYLATKLGMLYRHFHTADTSTLSFLYKSFRCVWDPSSSGKIRVSAPPHHPVVDPTLIKTVSTLCRRILRGACSPKSHCSLRKDFQSSLFVSALPSAHVLVCSETLQTFILRKAFKVTISAENESDSEDKGGQHMINGFGSNMQQH